MNAFVKAVKTYDSAHEDSDELLWRRLCHLLGVTVSNYRRKDTDSIKSVFFLHKACARVMGKGSPLSGGSIYVEVVTQLNIQARNIMVGELEGDVCLTERLVDAVKYYITALLYLRLTLVKDQSYALLIALARKPEIAKISFELIESEEFNDRWIALELIRFVVAKYPYLKERDCNFLHWRGPECFEALLNVIGSGDQRCSKVAIGVLDLFLKHDAVKRENLPENFWNQLIGCIGKERRVMISSIVILGEEKGVLLEGDLSEESFNFLKIWQEISSNEMSALRKIAWVKRRIRQ